MTSERALYGESGVGWMVPEKYGEVPLRLDDEAVVIAWARDPGALRAALEGLLRAHTAEA